MWFERVEGGQKPIPAASTLGKEDLLRSLEENERTYRELIPARLEEVIHFTRASGEKYHARVVDILLQLLTHGYHHRGQIAAHYARGGVRYPNTDHINYLIENRL